MAIRDENGWELVGYDHRTGVSRWHHFDGAVNHWRTDTPVDAILDANREDAASLAGSRRQGGVGELVARVPLAVFFDELAPAVRAKDDAHVSRWLNDGSNAAWRVRGGRA